MVSLAGRKQRASQAKQGLAMTLACLGVCVAGLKEVPRGGCPRGRFYRFHELQQHMVLGINPPHLTLMDWAQINSLYLFTPRWQIDLIAMQPSASTL